MFITCVDDSEEWCRRGSPFPVLLIPDWAQLGPLARWVWICPVPPFFLHHWGQKYSRLVQMQAQNQCFGESTRRSSQGRPEWLFALNVEKNKRFWHGEYHRPANADNVGHYGKNNLIQWMGKWKKKYTNIGIEVSDNLSHECYLWWKGVRHCWTKHLQVWLTRWTEICTEWSEIQQHLARQWLTHRLDKLWRQHLVRQWLTHILDKMWCKMVGNSTAPCETTVNSQAGQNVMWDGQKFDNTLQDDSWLTVWTKCDARWSEIQQHLGRQWLTHHLDEMWCKMVRNSITPCKVMVDSLSGQNVMWDGQKFNNTLQDNSGLTNWTKCNARWSKNQQHLARQQWTHKLDKM